MKTKFHISQKINETTYKIRLEAAFGLLFDDEDKNEVDTIGGWFFRNSNEVKVTTELEVHGYTLTVIEMEDHQILTIKMKKLTSEFKQQDNVVSS
ncbi:transporter associated domain-containing protein [Terribacillus aidingensis]|uniref:transporter associated domain-containing protein n=1 Tax=Terribacillus aidingensis TaxID=586416 RepID=UPI00344C1B51